MIEMYKKGVSTEMIAKEVSLSVRGVRYVLNQLGVKMRPTGRPKTKIDKPKREAVEEITNSTWKPIKGYEGLYEVSDKGQVRSLDRINHRGTKYKGRILRNRNTPNGYYAVMLSKNGIEKIYTVHRLVATTFIPNPENKEEINHKDGNKKKNILENLEWVTRSENVKHAYKTGLNPSGKGARSKGEIK